MFAPVSLLKKYAAKRALCIFHSDERLSLIVVLWLADTDVPSTVAAEAEAIVAVATESVIRAAVAMLMILVLIDFVMIDFSFNFPFVFLFVFVCVIVVSIFSKDPSVLNSFCGCSSEYVTMIHPNQAKVNTFLKVFFKSEPCLYCTINKLDFCS